MPMWEEDYMLFFFALNSPLCLFSLGMSLKKTFKFLIFILEWEFVWCQTIKKCYDTTFVDVWREKNSLNVNKVIKMST